MKHRVIVEKNVVFGETEREYLTADLYKPAQCEEELPILVLIHGGAFQTGSKEMYRDWGEHLAQEGYFVMAINYRLSTPAYATYPGVLNDLRMALNWLVGQANARGLNVGKIGLIGDSAGAHLASLFALKSQAFSYRIRAVVGVYGVYDLVEECKNPVVERGYNVSERFLGFSFKENEEAFKEASPITHIPYAVSCPTFDTSFYLIWGKADKVLNSVQSTRFYEELKEAKITVETTEIEDQGHFWFNELPGIEGGKVTDYPNNIVYPKIIRFLQEHVRNVENGNFSKRQLASLAAYENLTMKKAPEV